MNKNILPLLIVIASSLALSACTQTANQAATQKNNQAVTQNGANQDSVLAVEKQDQANNSFTGSIKDLMGDKKAQRCTWEIEGQGSSVVYVDGDKTRVENNMPAIEGQPARQMSVISDQEWSYSWDSVTQKGMKFKNTDENFNGNEYGDNDEMMAAEETSEDEVNSMENMNENFQFKCEPWKADSAMFVPPANVEFTDMNQMME